MTRPSQEYGLNENDREREILRKFGPGELHDVLRLLGLVAQPTEPLLGAIVFLARPGHMDDIRLLAALANEDASQVLDAATVKHERG